MAPQILEYRSGKTSRRMVDGRGAVVGVIVIAAMVVLVNGMFLYAVATQGPGDWTDLAVLCGLGPSANGLILALGLSCTPFVWPKSGGKCVIFYMLAAVVIPAFGYCVDVLFITGRR